MALPNVSIYYKWKNIKSEYNNNKSKILAPTWNDTFHLPDSSYSISDFQDYFEIINNNNNNNNNKIKTKRPPKNQLEIRGFKFMWTGLKQNCFQNKNMLQIRTVDSWNIEIIRKHNTKKGFDKDKDGENQILLKLF